MFRSRNRCDWRLSDEHWQRMQPLLPKYGPSPKGGQPRLPLDRVAKGTFYVLRTGGQWNKAPREYGAGRGLHLFFRNGPS